MAHTPIFKQLQRALRFAARLERSGVSTPEGLERDYETAWSRRKFLATSAVASVGTVLRPNLVAAKRTADAPKVVIVGAGTAGLVCAYRLQQNGIIARVIEASTRVGGRMFSLRNTFPDGQLTELGGEYIDTEHTDIRDLAKELGLTLNDLRAEAGVQAHTYYFDGHRIGSDAELIDLFRPVAKAIVADLDQMRVNDKVRIDTLHAREIDRLNISEWFQKRGVTGLIAKVFRAAYVGEFGLELDEQSALNLLLEIGSDTSPDEFHIFGASDERYHIAEGNDSVPTRLAQRLGRPVEVDSPVEAIAANGKGYRLSVRHDNASTEIPADILVLALPFTILRRLHLSVDLPEAKRRAIRELGYGTNAKLIAGFSRRVWSDSRSTGYTFTDLGFQCCWETSRGQPGVHAMLTNFAGGKLGEHLNDGTITEHAASFVREVERIYAGSQQAFTGQAVRQHWPSSPFVLGSYTCYKPGQYSALASHVATRVGNMFFAGEHTSLEFNGFMQGAVETGERAAKEVLKKIGRASPRAKAA